LFSLDAGNETGGRVEVAPPNVTPLDRAALATARKAPGVMRTVVRLGNTVQRRRMRRDHNLATR
jgi:hypothetical protein